MSESQASLLLRKQLKDISRNPVDGFSAGLVDDCNVFEWNVTIIGPPDTLYEGGYFNAIMSFPPNYPNSPPSVRFTSEMWHPNVYPDGRVCISILHAPGDDPNGYELASERWSPVHTVPVNDGVSTYSFSTCCRVNRRSIKRHSMSAWRKRLTGLFFSELVIKLRSVCGHILPIEVIRCG
jgi:ubiquitin-conjugating enzyme E2 G1